MNSISVPDYEANLEATIETLKTIRTNGGNPRRLQAVLRAVMFDEKLLEKQQRQAFLKRVNEALETDFSMNQVRKADPALANDPASDAPVIQGTLIPVDELHGTGVLELAEQTAETYVNNVKENWVDPAAAQVTEQAAPAVNESVELEQAADTQPTSLEQQAMPLGQEIKQDTATTATNSTTTTAAKEDTMNTAAQPTPFQLHLAAVVAIGYDTEAKRNELYNAFLTANLELQPQAQAVANDKLSNDEQFYAFVSKTPETLTAFIKFAEGFKPARQSVEARSRFSLRGERDEGIRSGWIAAGGALLGAALETGHSGSLSIGSGIGAVAAIAGSFFAADMLDEHIGSEFGRYTAAGTLGLAAGALGSGLGRMAHTAIAGKLNSNADGLPAALPAPTMSVPAVTPNASMAQMLGFKH